MTAKNNPGHRSRKELPELVKELKQPTGRVPNIPPLPYKDGKAIREASRQRAQAREALKAEIAAEQSAPSISKNLTGTTIRLNTVMNFSAIGFEYFYDFMHLDRGFFFPRHLKPLAMGLTDIRIPKLLVIVGPGSGKSVMLSTAFPAFVLGQDPSHTILGVSAGEALMQGFMAAVMEWIEHAPAWKFVFPDILPDKSRGWSTDRGMFIKGHAAGDPDASYLAAGLTSKRITGVHARLIIGDDLHDKENSASAIACQGVIDYYYSQIIGRADPRGARFIFAGRRWHEEDIYGHLKKTGEWVVMELPAIRENSDKLYWDITIPEGMECCFTELARGERPTNMGKQLSAEEIAEISREIERFKQGGESANYHVPGGATPLGG